MFLTVGIKALVNCLFFAKLLMYHTSSALIKLVQSPKPHKALHKTGLESTELFLNTTYLEARVEDGGWKDFKDPKLIDSSPGSTQRVVRPVEVAVVSTSSPTLSVSSAF